MASRILAAVAGVGMAGALLAAPIRAPRAAAQGAAETEADQVTPSELQLYIDVYSAMQADHALAIDTALAQKGVSLEEFRGIERRVQKQERLVRKVREALLAQAKARAEGLPPSAQLPGTEKAPQATK